jgi:tetratricopeptide (TPR) repeat protein
VTRFAAAFAMALATAVAAGLASAATAPDDQQPMFGNADRDADPGLRAADRLFVAAIVARYGGRREGSTAMSRDAWGLLRGNDAAGAMRLFNEAWIVDASYYDVYWGFGAILQERGELDAAIAMLERANALPDVHQSNLAPLLGDLANLYALKAASLAPGAAGRSEYFERANATFVQATSIDPANAQPWVQWIVGLLYQARYDEAWAKVAAARDRGHRVPEPVVTALRARSPEPAR